MADNVVLAADLGASSGRVIAGNFNGSSITTQEIHRFVNEPVFLNKTLYWDFLRLFYEIKQGLIRAKNYRARSLGIDTWGVDFGILDCQGYMLENPVHYRDIRTVGMLNRGLELLHPNLLYQLTGNQLMEINTAFQLLALKEQRNELLNKINKILFMPDLFNYFLTGLAFTEDSIASTSQLYNINNKQWDSLIFNSLSIPIQIMPEILPTGTILGKTSKSMINELGIDSLQITAVAGHDTQSALVAVPAEVDEFIFISCGTWSLFGTETDEPIINEKSLELNLTNECGFGNKVSFMKNITGLWLIQECRRQWMREGKEYSYAHLEQMANIEKPFSSFIHPSDSVFISAGDMPKRIKNYCKRTNQKIPINEGAIVRCINESLALSHRKALDEIQQCTGKYYKVIHMLGGGTKSRILCQMTANACDCTVIAGPSEATVYGNAAVQFIALKDIKDLKEAREVIRTSIETEIYEPQNVKQWNEAYLHFLSLDKMNPDKALF